MKKYTRQLEAFGKNLRRFRKECGLTQQALADDCELDRGTIARFETGKLYPSFQTLFALAEALEIEAKELIPLGSAK